MAKLKTTRGTAQEELCYLLRRAAQYVAKGIEAGAYRGTVLGDLGATRCYESLNEEIRSRCAR
jgi:hypothetical protein